MQDAQFLSAQFLSAAHNQRTIADGASNEASSGMHEGQAATYEFWSDAVVEFSSMTTDELVAQTHANEAQAQANADSALSDRNRAYYMGQVVASRFVRSVLELG